MANEYEFIKHLEGTYFKTFFVSIERRLYHWHNDIELLLVIEGSVIVNTAQDQYVLKKDDLFLMNRNEIHSLIRTKEINTILAIQFDPKFCKAYYPRLQRIKFNDNHIKLDEHQKGREKIKKCLIDIVMNYFKKERGYQLKLVSALNMMVYDLLYYIPYEEIEEDKLFAEEKNLERLNRIIDYIQENYTGKISLKDLAARENLDMYYLSHFIKKQMGISFQQYINKVRLEKAVDLITQTNNKRIDICIECGFSDYRYLSKLFFKEYGCTPSHYKFEYKNLEHLEHYFFLSSMEEQQRIINQNEALKKFMQYLEKEALT